jgi:hypothetical protein
MDRLAVLNLYSEEAGNMPSDRGGFIREVVAFCTLNIHILAFTVRRRKFFLKTYYELHISLPSKNSSSAFGTLSFDSAEEATHFGCDFLKHLFPAIKFEIKEEDLEITACPKVPD